jgi:hypothetical protein
MVKLRLDFHHHRGYVWRTSMTSLRKPHSISFCGRNFLGENVTGSITPQEHGQLFARWNMREERPATFFHGIFDA